MGGAQRAFSQSCPDDGPRNNELAELTSGIDPIGRVIDSLACVYGWSMEYILDQPYTKLRELLSAIRLREYLETIKLYRLHGLAQGGDDRQVQQFFNDVKPKIRKTETVKDQGQTQPNFEAMSLDGFSYVRKG